MSKSQSNTAIKERKRPLKKTFKKSARLEAELTHAKMQLQTVREELEASNKELGIRSSLLHGILDNSMGATMALKALYNEDLDLVDFEWTMANSLCKRFTGKNHFALIGEKLRCVAPFWCDDIFLNVCKSVMESKKSLEFSRTFVDNVETICIKLSVAAFEDGIVVTLDDITFIQSAMDALMISEQKAQKERIFAEELIESSNVIVVVLDKNADILRFNKSAESISGYGKNYVLGKNWISMFLPKTKSKQTSKLFKKILQTNDSQMQKKSIMLTDDGQEKIISWRYSGCSDADGERLILAFGIDVTEKQLAKQ